MGVEKECIMATATAKSVSMKAQKINVSSAYQEQEGPVLRTVRNVSRDEFTRSLNGEISFDSLTLPVTRPAHHRVWVLA